MFIGFINVMNQLQTLFLFYQKIILQLNEQVVQKQKKLLDLQADLRLVIDNTNTNQINNTNTNQINNTNINQINNTNINQINSINSN